MLRQANQHPCQDLNDDDLDCNPWSRSRGLDGLEGAQSQQKINLEVPKEIRMLSISEISCRFETEGNVHRK